jgi:hypothetical protein
LAWSAFGAIALSAIAACTLIVDSEFKGYSDSCTLPHSSDNVCGQCVTQNCQDKINANCADNGHSLGTSLSSCMEDPSPSRYGNDNCSQFLDAAPVPGSNEPASQLNLRLCITQSCSDPCRVCTEIDLGTTDCGNCIREQCGKMLDGVMGCCNEDGVRSGLSQCLDSNPSAAQCDDFTTKADAAALNEDAGRCTYDAFGACVVSRCVMPGRCKP